LEETRERLKRTQAYVVLDYRGLTVTQMEALRVELRKNGSEIAVLKNTLFRMAAADTNTAVDDEFLHGPTAVAFGYDDPVAPARVLNEFVKTHPNISIKGGSVENHTLTADQVVALAKTPSREVLLSQFAGVLQAPMSKFAGGLDALMSQFARLLQAHADKQESEPAQ
jgi:large subunit ribosomal protein L10